MFDFTAQDLRRNPTTSEIILWQHLKARQMVGLKFRRQHPIGPFIVDFVCLKKNLIVEVDGPIHDLRRDYDRWRDEWLRKQGFEVIRIKNEDLGLDLKETLTKLRDIFLKKIGF